MMVELLSIWMVLVSLNLIIGINMPEMTLQLDKQASKSIEELMKYYNVGSRAELVSKAISMLKVAAYIGKTDGELIARKNGEETRITMT